MDLVEFMGFRQQQSKLFFPFLCTYRETNHKITTILEEEEIRNKKLRSLSSRRDCANGKKRD
jgi:hypothetical protein